MQNVVWMLLDCWMITVFTSFLPQAVLALKTKPCVVDLHTVTLTSKPIIEGLPNYSDNFTVCLSNTSVLLSD